MSGRHKSTKRQARLSFTPLPSSSPAAKGYHKQIQDRAAAVSLEGSAKRRKIRDMDPDCGLGAQMDGVNDSLPTPAGSRQQGTREATEDSDSEPVRSTQRLPSSKHTATSRTKSRQQALDFSSARDPDTFSSPVKLSSPSRPQSSARAGMFSTQGKRQIVDVSSDESEEELPSPGKLVSKQKANKMKGVSTNGHNKRATRSSQHRKFQPITVDSGSESDSEDIVVNRKSSQAVEVDSNNDDDDDEDMPTTLGTQRRKRARRSSKNSFISSSPPRAVESDSDVEIIEQPQKRRPRANNSEDEDENDAATPSRRKRVKRQVSKRDQKDLEDDLEFLEPSSDVEALQREPRNTQTRAKDARSKALEALKRRRSGQVAEPEPEQIPEEDEVEDNQDDSEDDYETVPTQPISSRKFFQADDADDDFVDEEGEDDLLGVPEDLPIEFTRYASMKPKELFKHAVEWMVQKKINPAFQRNDGLYELTFRKLDDEVKGLAGSKFKSAAWTPEFTIALNSRPDIAYEPIDRHEPEHYMRDHCDACNRSKHPATYQIQFQGKPYYPETLEDVAQGEEEDDDDSDSEDTAACDKDDEPSYDARGSAVPPESKIYYVGKFCMSNAQTAHALQHWRYHLNEWVLTWLIKNGYDTPERIVERDGMKTKQRGRFANKIVDRMEKEGVVKTLWSDFRGKIDEARDSKQGRY